MTEEHATSSTSRQAADYEPPSALVLTGKEWAALAGLCRFYLKEQRGAFLDRIAIAERIIEAAK